MSEQSARLRALLGKPGLLRAPGVFDGLSAHLARRAGFDIAYLTGGGVAASGFGLPDIGLVTATEMVDRARMIVGACGLPLIADADTGYGNAMHVVRTVRDFERAGVAAIQLEDQAFPKRCGHLAHKQIITADEFSKKLGAALDARREGIVVIARTDARGPVDLDDAIGRAQRYALEGADMIFVEAPRSIAEIERISKEIDTPLLFNVLKGGLTPQIDETHLEEMGYRVAIYPGALLGAAAAAMARALVGIGGRPSEKTTGPADFFGLVGLAEWAEIDERYR